MLSANKVIISTPQTEPPLKEGIQADLEEVMDLSEQAEQESNGSEEATSQGGDGQV